MAWWQIALALITNLPSVISLGAQIVQLIKNAVHPSQQPAVIAAMKGALKTAIAGSSNPLNTLHADIAAGAYADASGPKA